MTRKDYIERLNSLENQKNSVNEIHRERQRQINRKCADAIRAAQDVANAERNAELKNHVSAMQSIEVAIAALKDLYTAEYEAEKGEAQ